ncbi:tetratricopeptide repeat protein [Streptomyces sp. NPDC057702]|uniref:tetratricopeptide repeat protein n=1 Tax=unclassified Streptomyces TaxID=2593676 RepID=UPI003696B84F
MTPWPRRRTERPVTPPAPAVKAAPTLTPTVPVAPPATPVTPVPATATTAAHAERSLAVGGNIAGIASSGDHATNLQIHLPPEAFRPMRELAAPAGLVRLPPTLDRFVGRARDLDRLDASLAGPGGVVVQALHGLGGIGKSTLAAHWAATRAADHYPIWWITADSPAALDAGLEALATALQPELSGLLPLKALRERAVQWLAAHDGWLVILDNVNDPADIRPLLERTRGGRFLVTSRRTVGWRGLATPVPVDVLDPAEAVDLLTRILPGTADPDGADALCAELGCLPLAVEQAGAYIAEAGITPRAYLDLLAAYPAAMYQHSAEGTDPARSIARVWHVTLDRLAGDPLTGTLLRTLAWYAPDDLPRHLLDGIATPPELTRALGRLAAYGLLTLHHDTATLSVHRLVQAVARTPDPEDPHRQPRDVDAARHQATRQLFRATPASWDEPTHWPAWRALLPHVEALIEHTPPDADTLHTANLLNRTGLYLKSQGALARAIRYYQRGLADLTKLLGADHRATLAHQNNLASAYKAAGDPWHAVELHERNLADRIRVLRADHPEIFNSRNNLASAYKAAGEPLRAIALHRRNLADRERVLGADHPDTLTSRNNLASAYKSAGQPRRAATLHERNLADRVRVLGQRHPSTLISRNNLAEAYRSMGEVGRSVGLHESNLVDRERVLGADHPATLISRNNLAEAYAEMGEPRRAAELHERNLADRVRVLGEGHPSTLISRNNLAEAYAGMGEPRRAAELHERNLASRSRLLGEDHRSTVTSRVHLAEAYRAAGDLRGAADHFERALSDARQVWDADHPRIAAIARALSALRAAGPPSDDGPAPGRR